MQQHELVCKQDFVLRQPSDLDALENYLRRQLFCQENVPCSVLLTESYKKFRVSCCRVMASFANCANFANFSNTVHGGNDAGADPSTHGFAVPDAVFHGSVFLDASWKLELCGNRVSVLKLESKTFDPLLPDLHPSHAPQDAAEAGGGLGILGRKRSASGETRDVYGRGVDDMV